MGSTLMIFGMGLNTCFGEAAVPNVRDVQACDRTRAKVHAQHQTSVTIMSPNPSIFELTRNLRLFAVADACAAPEHLILCALPRRCRQWLPAVEGRYQSSRKTTQCGMTPAQNMFLRTAAAKRTQMVLLALCSCSPSGWRPGAHLG